MTKSPGNLLSALAILSAPLMSVQALAQAPVPTPRYSMPSTQMWNLPSDNGDIYSVFVSFPKGEAPASGYPVLYVTDGNASFASFAETRRRLEYYDLGKAIVVGVGYPTDDPYDARRAADFLYPVPLPKGSTKVQESPTANGRDRFLDFLTGKLRTEIGRRYKIDLERQSLFGHSFGGLLALHALFTRPQAFQSIVAASPSLGWNTQEMLHEEREFAAGLKSGKTVKMSRLMIVVGDRDTDDDPEPARTLASRMDLLSAYGMNTRYHRYDGEIHITVPTRAVTDTLRFAFQ
ncbi:MAG: alpha/beta hydrolase [Sphingomonadales bacterium]|nr:alpha/beta hydrolase [Sphingomonadales bacterium]